MFFCSKVRLWCVFIGLKCLNLQIFVIFIQMKVLLLRNLREVFCFHIFIVRTICVIHECVSIFFSLLLLLFFVVLDWFNSILNTRHQHIYVKCCKSVVSCTYDLIWKHHNRLSQLKIHFGFSPYRRNTIKMYN